MYFATCNWSRISHYRFIFNFFPVCESVRLLADSVIPPHALRGHQAVLRCNYDLEGDDLYSVKWYFNQKEFYRYIPTDNPKVTIFNHHEGVKVNVSIKIIFWLILWNWISSGTILLHIKIKKCFMSLACSLIHVQL